jgi:hypothetical protein
MELDTDDLLFAKPDEVSRTVPTIETSQNTPGQLALDYGDLSAASVLLSISMDAWGASTAGY